MSNIVELRPETPIEIRYTGTNADIIRALGVRRRIPNERVIAMSVQLFRYVYDHTDKGDEFWIKHKNGKWSKILFEDWHG